jgi:hypothetical protein
MQVMAERLDGGLGMNFHNLTTAGGTVQRCVLARAAKGDDPKGYRSEFIRLVEKAELLKK